MINFNSIPADVQQFMIDKMTDDVSRHSIRALIMLLVYAGFIVLWVVLTVKNKSNKITGFVWICLDAVFLVFEIYYFCSDKAKLEQYQDSPQIAVIDYIKKAYNDDEYRDELYIRGIDIYGNYKG